MKKILKNKSVHHLIIGFLLSSLLYLYTEYRFERKTLLAFVDTVYNTTNLERNNKEQLALASMEFVHNKMRNVDPMSMHLNLNSFEQYFTSPTMQFALTKEGACGGNTLVLAQVLKEMGYDVRPGQMLVKGKFGGHIILVVKINNKWIVMDPLYNLSFRNEKKELATFYEVNANWAFYSKQVPSNYNFDYRYDGIQFTNWKKASVLGMTVKSILNKTIGKDAADSFSFRKHLLNPKKLLFYFAIFIFSSFFLLYSKTKLKRQVLVFGNFLKYCIGKPPVVVKY